MTPPKYDAEILQALLIQVRRDAVGSNHVPMLPPTLVTLSPVNIDELAAYLHHKVSRNRSFLT
jgi:hypothetical protein